MKISPHHSIERAVLWFPAYQKKYMLTQKQIQNICEEIKKDPYVVAILLTGSYVYGTPSEKSDLDIRMIVKEKEYERAHWDDLMRFGVRIEAFYNTIETIEDYMEKARKKEGPPNVIHFWAHGKIVFDPQNEAKKLQEKARELWKLGSYKGKWENIK